MAKASSKSVPVLLYFTVAAVLLTFSIVAAAETAAPETIMEDCSFPTKTSSSFEKGLRVWIDPDTGELREPTDEERKAAAKHFTLESLLNRSHEGLEIEVKPNGTKIVHLKGRFMHALVATRDEDGTLTTRCINHEDELTRAKADSVPVR